ncbi:MAG: serine hydrolase [Elusimicrobia bacterium]|nr:serine hydrolase [Elusimicrobiota bacterium]
MRIVRLLVVAALLAPSVPAHAQDEARFDISYYWDLDAARARAQRDAVASALGPNVDAKLKVVRSETGWAVVYRRDGDADGARLAAQTHTRILQARGLGAAAPVRARAWSEAAADGEPAGIVQRRALEALVEMRVKELRRRGRIAADERTAWTVYDFTTGEQLVSINEDLKLQAASLIKPFVVLAYFEEVRAGRRVYDAAMARRMERMIQRSDNPATNAVMRNLGGPPAVARILRRNYGQLFGDLELVEYIPAGGRTYKNRASARDYSRYLLSLWKGTLPYSKEIKRLMALPKRDRLHTGARDVPDDVGIHSKTGSTRHLCGDMGVLRAKAADGREYPYALVGIIEKRAPARNYMRWLHARGDVIREISSMVYRRIGERHGFLPSGIAAR